MIRPRLLVVSLVVAALVSVPAGWALSRVLADGDGLPPDEVLAAESATVDRDVVVMDVPGEYQHPLDEGDAAAGGSTTGTRLPELTLEDADGSPVSTAELVGSPAVVNVWFSTCPPCARELADFAEVHAEVGDRIRFVGVNPFDVSSTMVDFAAERGVTYELWRDVDGEFLDGVAVVTFPRTFFVDERGVVVAEAGVLDADQLRAAIEEVF